MSHGVPRAAGKADRSEEARQREINQIAAYQGLVEEVNTKVEAKAFTPQVLQQTAELLKQNPEYYTIWNHRRRIYANEFKDLSASAAADQLSEQDRVSQILDIIQLDLQFLFPLLLKFPKCYWIWNHRLWLLDRATELLPSDKATSLWTEELGLVGKMLTRDSRNFHGWEYRRTVVSSLEKLKSESMAKAELDYTTKMIKLNLSNFSAWHSRSKLILRSLNEQKASDEERKQMLDAELELIHKALFDPYDQSLWFYHQNLMCTFDPKLAPSTMAPNLSNEEREERLMAEREYVEELLEDTSDCKWVYQALIELSLLEGNLNGHLSNDGRRKVEGYIEKLKTLDPLRKGRWMDLERSMNTL